MNLKTLYAINHSTYHHNSLYLNERLFHTYNKITNKLLGISLKGVNVDLGSGDRGFSKYCESIGIKSYPYDYPDFNIEEDNLPHKDNSVDFITMNAVIEHLSDPSNALKESRRVLKSKGLIFIRTPNWKMDWKNFYNDPTHVKPYAPETLKILLKLFDFKIIFLGPGLIEKSWIWWKLPETIKWKIAARLKGGTKSIIVVGMKNKVG